MKDTYVQSLEEEIKMLRSQLTFDSNTGLYNLHTNTGKMILESRLEFASRSDNPPEVVFLFIDFDNLHPANKLYGSDSTDLLLLTFADILRKCSRTSDFVFREGNSGDEFGIVFFNFSIKDIQTKLMEIDEEFIKSLEKLESDPKFNSAKESPKNVVSFSAGVTNINFIKKEDEKNRFYNKYEPIFGDRGGRKRAEAMCEKAKKEGKNRFVSDSIQTPTVIRKGFESPNRTQYDNV